MGTRYRKMYLESVAAGHPMLWVAPPTNIVLSDFTETMVNSIMAMGGTCVLVGGIQVVTSGRFDIVSCIAWGGISAGIVILSPIAGDVLSDLTSDIRQGWERGHIAKPEPEPEPITQAAIEPTEDEAGAARIEGEWWYPTHRSPGHLACYKTPVDKHRRPQISDARMRAIFGAALTGTPFSEREMVEKVSGLSGPRFRILKQDWRIRSFYIMLPDKSGYFTRTGKLIASVIANYNPPTPV